MAAPQTRPRDDTAPCIGCGLCCDGTMFDHATVASGEEGRLKDSGMELATSKGRTVFLHPCPQAQCGRCLIYEARPDVCRSFRCNLLKQYHAGEIDLAAARATIEKALALVAAVKADDPAAAMNKERRRLRSRLAEQLHTGSDTERRDRGRRLLNLVALDEYLAGNFRKKKKANDAGGIVPPNVPADR